jgi:hypothetical protein
LPGLYLYHIRIECRDIGDIEYTDLRDTRDIGDIQTMETAECWDRDIRYQYKTKIPTRMQNTRIQNYSDIEYKIPKTRVLEVGI